jgi:hypothetical protein
MISGYCPVMPASREISEIRTGRALGILHAGEADRGFEGQVADAGGDGGVVGGNALVIKAQHLGAGIGHALVEAAQGSGAEVEGSQLDLLGGQSVVGAAAGGGPVESEADGQDDDGGQQQGKAGVVPGEWGEQALAPDGGDFGGHRGPPGWGLDGGWDWPV